MIPVDTISNIHDVTNPFLGLFVDLKSQSPVVVFDLASLDAAIMRIPVQLLPMPYDHRPYSLPQPDLWLRTVRLDQTY